MGRPRKDGTPARPARPSHHARSRDEGRTSHHARSTPDSERVALPRAALILLGMIVGYVVGSFLMRHLRAIEPEEFSPAPDRPAPGVMTVPAAQELADGLTSAINHNAKANQKTFGQIDGELAEIYHRLEQLEKADNPPEGPADAG